MGDVPRSIVRLSIADALGRLHNQRIELTGLIAAQNEGSVVK